MRFWLTALALFLLLLMARSRGGQPERIASQIYLAAFCLNVGLEKLVGPIGFAKLNLPTFASDLPLFLGIIAVSIRANRFWPLLAGALQLIVVITHLAKLLGIRGMVGVYWGMTTIPIYLQLLVLLGGIWAHQSRLRRIGPYPDWRDF